VEVLAARLGLLAEGGDVQEHRLVVPDAVDSDTHGTEGGAFGRIAKLGIGVSRPVSVSRFMGSPCRVSGMD
jgi:hypothetical protein